MARTSFETDLVSVSPFSVIVPVASFRKWPDPVFPAIHHYSGYVPSLLYPAGGFPNDPNLRPANIDRAIYEGVGKSLLNEECTPNSYHLKSKGEIQAASSVRELSPTESKEWYETHLLPHVSDAVLAEFQRKYTLVEITYTEGQGILDGGHTDRIWSNEEHRASIRETYDTELDPPLEPNRNHLPIEWLTGIPDKLVSEIVGGRNTGIQVQTKTLANHQQKFDWLKALLGSEPYADKIAYRENELRSEKPVDIREVLALIAPFNLDLYSLEGNGKKLPLSAFSQKQAVLDVYVEDQEGEKTYCRLKNIVKDILILHDLIHAEAVDQYNSAKKIKGGQGRGGGFTFVNYRDQNRKNINGKPNPQEPHKLWFTWENGDPATSYYRLADGALYPMLAAFSALVEKDKAGNFAWRTKNGFEGVKTLWRELAADFMELTGNKSYEVGRNPAQIGKSSNHWEFLYMKAQKKAGL